MSKRNKILQEKGTNTNNTVKGRSRNMYYKRKTALGEEEDKEEVK